MKVIVFLILSTKLGPIIWKLNLVNLIKMKSTKLSQTLSLCLSYLPSSSFSHHHHLRFISSGQITTIKSRQQRNGHHTRPSDHHWFNTGSPGPSFNIFQPPSTLSILCSSSLLSWKHNRVWVWNGFETEKSTAKTPIPKSQIAVVAADTKQSSPPVASGFHHVVYRWIAID